MTPRLPEKRGGYFSLRFAAFSFDLLLIYFVQAVGSYFGGVLAGVMIESNGEVPLMEMEQAVTTGILLGWIFWGFVSWFLNYGVLQGLTGASLGKKICGLRVVNSKGEIPGILHSFFRAVCYHFSAIPFFAGFIFGFWNKNAQTWHDLICRTYVIPEKAIAGTNVVPFPEKSAEDEAA